MRCQLRIAEGLSFFIVAASVLTGAGTTSAADESIRSQAVVDLTFDEADGNALDTSDAGEGANDGKLMNGARRVPSPFWGQSGKQALLLESARKQFVQVEDAPDVDVADAVSLSFFFLNLVDSNDGGIRGIVSKRLDVKPKKGERRGRQAGPKASVNYGISYIPNQDIFSLYVSDGGDIRPVLYSFKDVIGFRRRVFLTATFEVGNAPDSGAGTEDDDVRISLFVNGQPVAPKSVLKGNVVGNDAWITNLEFDKLVNDAPLTIGSSTPSREFTDGLIDEFCLLPRALSASEAAELFKQVAGSDAAQLAKQELQPATGEPVVTSVSQRGLQVGQTTAIEIKGRNLGSNPSLVLPIPGMSQEVSDQSTPAKLVVKVTLPEEARAGFYPLSIKTGKGVSNALTVAVDRLSQLTQKADSPEHPASLPAAFSGTLSGADVARVYFRGKAGDRIVADVESKRLGAKLDPVIELKNERGTPLAIEWGRVQFQRDTRLEVELPSDGLYSIELHDLEFKAAGQNPYRLKIGNLNLVDAVFPPAVSRGEKAVLEPVGTGMSPGSLIAAEFPQAIPGTCELIDIPSNLETSGPMPVVLVSEGSEIIETPTEDGKPQRIAAQFAEGESSRITINGRILAADEEDVYVLSVTPGQKLNCSVEARAFNSPLDGVLTIRDASGKQLAKNTDRPGTRDPGLEYEVPKGVEEVQVAVGDLYGKGGSHFVYRLHIEPSGQPEYSIRLMTSLVNIPKHGNAVVQMEVDRSGYEEAIQLKVLGDESVSVAPAEIPAGKGKSTFFVTLSHAGENAPADVGRLRIVGESVGLKHPVRSVATLHSQFDGSSAPGYRDTLPVAFTDPSDISLDVIEKPDVVYRGLDTSLQVKLSRSEHPIDAGNNLRFELLTTQAVRAGLAPANPFAPRNPGNRPVAVSPHQSMSGQDQGGNLKIDVPAEITENTVDLVLRADVVPHPYSNRVLASIYSKPFRMEVKNAVDIDFVPKSFILTSGRQGKIRGTLKRGGVFKDAIELEVIGIGPGTLLPDFSALKVTVPPDQDEFEIVVNPSKVNEELDIPIARLRVTTQSGLLILPEIVLPFKVVPDNVEDAENPDQEVAAAE